MFGRGDKTTHDRGNSPRQGVGFYAAATLMGIVVVALVAVLVVVATRHNTPVTTATGGPGASPTETTPTENTPGGATPVGALPGDAGRPAGCTTTGTEQKVPTATPTGVTWNLVQGTAVPSSAADGPTLHSPAGVGYCYSRTPVGALLAVSNLGPYPGDAQHVQDDVLKHSIVPGPLADQIAATPAVASSPGGGWQYAGFRIISYTADSASIAVAVSTASHPGVYGVGTAAMHWYQGDWRVAMQPGPTVLVTGTTTTSLLDYVPWVGVS